MNVANSKKTHSNDDKNISGDGDGIKNKTPIRYPMLSSRKFTPTITNTKDMKSKLELALKEMKSPNKKHGLRRKLRTECASVDTPVRIPKRVCLKSAENNDKIRIYCSPRGAPLREKFPEGAARLVLRYLLLNSWRKSRSRCSDYSSLLAVKQDKINQLHMQIDVLQNLRKTESSRREEISVKYHEMQREFDDVTQNNNSLRNHIECLDKDKFYLVTELKEINEKGQFYQQEITEKNNNLIAISEKFQKEKEKLRKTTAEKKYAQEQNYKLENIINIQKENIENLKSCVESLQKSKLDLHSKLEKTQENCKQYSEQLRTLISENSKYKSKMSTYEIEKEQLCKEVDILKKQLEMTLKDFNDLKDQHEFTKMELQNLSITIEDERNFLRNFMMKGVISTYSALKYLAEKIIPALQANFTY